MKSFQDYKKEISIMQAASYIGFEPNYGKGRRTLVMELRENGKKIDEILIKNANTPNEHYFDRNKKGGDLISFIKNHINDFKNVQGINNEWLKINTVLSDIAADGENLKLQVARQIKPKEKFEIEKFNLRAAEINDLIYLSRERKLNQHTIKAFLSNIQISENGKFKNIAFPFHNSKNEITNLELVNFKFKGFSTGGDKSDAAWISNRNTSLVKDVFIFESTIDAMSYYQLNKAKINLNTSSFVAVGGYFAKGQLNSIINRFPNAKFHTGFDNDINGQIYTAIVEAKLNGKEMAILKNKEKGTIDFELNQKAFSIPENEFTLGKFREKTRFKEKVSQHLPGKQFNDFNDVVKGLSNGRKY